MTPDALFASLSSVFAAHLGTLVLYMLVPMTASLVLVGAVAMFRGSGLKPILVATGLTVGMALVGIGIRHYGLHAMVGSAQYAQNLNAVESNESIFLMISVPLSFAAFAIRSLRLVIAK